MTAGLTSSPLDGFSHVPNVGLRKPQGSVPQRSGHSPSPAPGQEDPAREGSDLGERSQVPLQENSLAPLGLGTWGLTSAPPVARGSA